MITRLMLVNAQTGENLRELGFAEIIVLETDGQLLNIRADVSEKTGSVGFDLLDPETERPVRVATENIAPYYIAGDVSGKPREWCPPLGVWKLAVTPYPRSNRGGVAGEPMEVVLTVLAKQPDPRPLNYVSPPMRFPNGLGLSSWPFRVDPYTVGTPRNDPGDYWSDSGQVAYDPDGSIEGDPGLGATAHFAYAHGVFATQPRWDPTQYRGTPNPDPSVRISSYIDANGGLSLQDCIKQVRSTNTTGNCAFVLWENGLLTAACTQTGHGNVPWPALKLPATKRVHDLAITSNNELALISCTDTETGVGQIAVVMVEGRGLPQHTFAQMGLFNQASLSDFRLLGYVDLPLREPTKLSAACNGRWNGPSETNGKTLGQIDLTVESNLSLLYDGDWQKTIAKNGYAVVISQKENRAVVVDLSPVFQYIRQSWLSSLTFFQATTAARIAGLWPHTFEEMPETRPAVVKEFDVPEPVSVLCGHYVERFSHDRFKFHVGMADGNMAIFDASPIMARFSYQAKAPAIRELGRMMVGRSPVGMCFSRRDEGLGNLIFAPSTTQSGDGQNSVIWVACDKDRKVVEILTFGGNGTVLRTLEDQRMQEPVDVVTCQRGYVVLVCDYAGRQIVGWRIGNLTDKRVNPELVYAPGQPEGYEISGFLRIPGNPKKITSSNVN